MSKNYYCNNCGKPGHLFNHCKMPITSTGVIAVRRSKHGTLEYLLIRRKESLGYIDFMRGKYSVQNKAYIMNMFKQMTDYEKERLRTTPFDVLWNDIWGGGGCTNRYKIEEGISREKHASLTLGIVLRNDYYTLNTLIEESKQYASWEEPEWGFPKGRRNSNENDFDCAMREFCEETGYLYETVRPIHNIMPLEEIFTGSNYISYKHKYFVVFMKYEDTLNMNNYQRSEVSKMEWCDIDRCLTSIREYNLEKKHIICNVDKCLKQHSVYQS